MAFVRTLIVALLVPATLVAQTLGPAGGVITQDNFPLQEALRPIGSPVGMLQVELTLAVDSRPPPPPNEQYNISLPPTFSGEVSYGFSHGFSVSAGGDVGGSSGGFINLLEQPAANFAIALNGGYYTQSGPQLVTGTGWVSAGLPVKFLIPGVPLAIRGLETLLDVNDLRVLNTVSLSLGGISSEEVNVEGSLPLWLEFSPFWYLTLAAGATAYAYATPAVQPLKLDGTISYFGSVNGTFPWVDVGIGVAQYVYLNGAPSLTEVWGYVDLRVWAASL